MRKKYRIFLSIILCLMFVGCSNSTSGLTKGSKHAFTKDAFIGVTKQDLNDGISYVKNNNNEAFQNAVKQGRIIEFTTGEEITIDELHGTTVEVEDSQGNKGYSILEVLK